MICAFCGYEFDPTQAPACCANCAMSGSCHMVRCPRCGYEAPAESRLSKLIKSIRRAISGSIG
ncbi:MAG: hypothetical protein M1531_01805 [Chloroflexi bacterium]|nr:hypothetical protein [Chloroflexota bacterium]